VCGKGQVAHPGITRGGDSSLPGQGWGASPMGATGAESFDPPLGILSGRDQGCDSVAHSQGRVTPHPWPWPTGTPWPTGMPGTALRLTPWGQGDARGPGDTQQGKGLLHHDRNRSEERQGPSAISRTSLPAPYASAVALWDLLGKKRKMCKHPQARAPASLSFQDNVMQLSWSQPINTQMSFQLLVKLPHCASQGLDIRAKIPQR